MTPTNRTIVAPFLQESLNLQKALAGGLTASALSRWAENSPTRQAVLQDTVWGEIRWVKSAGKSLSATLAEGFAISHEYHYTRYEQVGPDDYIELDTWATRPTPLTWDGPGDPDNYVVSYFAQAVPGWPNRISVSFAPGVSWSVMEVRGYRVIDPPWRMFAEVGEHVQLPDFNVAAAPYFSV